MNLNMLLFLFWLFRTVMLLAGSYFVTITIQSTMETLKIHREPWQYGMLFMGTYWFIKHICEIVDYYAATEDSEER